MKTSNNISVGTRDDRLLTTSGEKKIGEKKDEKIRWEEKNYEKFVRGWCVTTKSRVAHDLNW